MNPLDLTPKLYATNSSFFCRSNEKVVYNYNFCNIYRITDAIILLSIVDASTLLYNTIIFYIEALLDAKYEPFRLQQQPERQEKIYVCDRNREHDLMLKIMLHQERMYNK